MPSRKSADAQLALPLDPVPAAAARPPLHIRHSRRARRLQIKVSPWRGVEVVVPPRHSASRVEAFVAANRDWIGKTWRQVCAELPDQGQLRRPELIELAALKRRVRVVYRSGPKPGWEMPDPEHLFVTVPNAELRPAVEVLRDWLACLAREELLPRLAHESRRTGLRYRRAQIRRQRTRWGSCSAKGTIALNCKLLFVDPKVLRYLLVHELCHTRHMNHSKRFWNLVAEFEPDYQRLDRTLTRAARDVPGWMEV